MRWTWAQSQTVSHMPKIQLRQNADAYWRSHRKICQSWLGVSRTCMLLGVTSLGAHYRPTVCVQPLPPTASSSKKEFNPPAGRGVGDLLSYVAESAKVEWKQGQSLEQDLRVQESKTLSLAREIKNERHQLLPQDTGFCHIFLVSIWSKVVLSCFCLIWVGFRGFFATCGRKSNSLLVLHSELALLQGYIVEQFLFPSTSWASLPYTLLV